MQTALQSHAPARDVAGAATRKGHLLFVDALRGAACLWVILHHTFQAYGLPHGVQYLPGHLFIKFSQLGWLGVNLFLELSGFCLFYPLVKKQALPAVKLNIASFFVKRARRILPPYYAALFLTALFNIIRQHMGLDRPHPFLGVFSSRVDLALHLTMLFNVFVNTLGSVSGVFWSLALEWDLYLLFPLLVFLAARYGLRAVLAPTFVVAVLWQSWAYHRLGFSALWTAQFSVFYDNLPGRTFEFACGMTAAYYVAKPVAGQYKAAGVLLGVLLIPGLAYILGVSRFGPLLDQIWGVIFACVLVLSSRIADKSFLQNRAGSLLVWIGTISYSLYLVHFPLITLTLPAALHLPETPRVMWLLGFARLPLLIGIAYLFHLAFERPFMSRPAPKTEAQAEIAAVANPAP